MKAPTLRLYASVGHMIRRRVRYCLRLRLWRRGGQFAWSGLHRGNGLVYLYSTLDGVARWGHRSRLSKLARTENWMAADVLFHEVLIFMLIGCIGLTIPQRIFSYIRLLGLIRFSFGPRLPPPELRLGDARFILLLPMYCTIYYQDPRRSIERPDIIPRPTLSPMGVW